MFDLVQLRILAGNGGNGRVSFHREKFINKGGPDGGDGGDGGSVIVRASKTFNTLQHFAGLKEVVAKAGEAGGQKNQIGGKGADTIIDVPVGTRIWLTGENAASARRRRFVPREGQTEPPIRHRMFSLTVKGGRVEALPVDDIQPLGTYKEVQSDEDVRAAERLAEGQMGGQQVVQRTESLKNQRFQDIPKELFVELREDGQTCVLCKGGVGGRGNVAFKGSSNTTPVTAEYGTAGERKAVLFELRLIADVGLVGYPNAGKSTFLSIVTRANPKIANYPFTTLEPNLGVMYMEEGGGRDVVLADIPGLIEGASKGKGLGYEFLRHVQACRGLLFLLTLEESQIYDMSVSEQEKAAALWSQYQVLIKELREYDAELLDRPRIVALSKSDLYSDELQRAISDLFSSHQETIRMFSSVTKNGLETIRVALRDILV